MRSFSEHIKLAVDRKEYEIAIMSIPGSSNWSAEINGLGKVIFIEHDGNLQRMGGVTIPMDLLQGIMSFIKQQL